MVDGGHKHEVDGGHKQGVLSAANAAVAAVEGCCTCVRHTHLIWRLDVEMDAVPIHGLAILFRALVFHGAASCARLNRRLKHN